jgi:hypothetical protein
VIFYAIFTDKRPNIGYNTIKPVQYRFNAVIPMASFLPAVLALFFSQERKDPSGTRTGRVFA